MKLGILKSAKVVYQWGRHHMVFVVPLVLLEREFLDIARETFSNEL